MTQASQDTALPYGYSWAFVALEYYALILNRIMLVLVCDRVISLAYMGGPVAALPFPEAANDMRYWLSDRYLRKYDGMNVASPAFLSAGWLNRQYERHQIAAVRLNLRPKWGMGTVPYSGRIHVAWHHRRQETELILLGHQDGPTIRDRLAPLADGVVSSTLPPAPVFKPFGERPVPSF